MHTLWLHVLIRILSARYDVMLIQNRRLREPLQEPSALNDDSEGHLVYKDGDILQARCTQNFSPTSNDFRHISWTGF